MTDLEQIASELATDWCATFVATPDGDGLVVSTPFEYPDGDAFAIWIARHADKWMITDRGVTLGAFPSAGAFDITENRLASIRTYVKTRGCNLVDGELRRVTDEAPDVYELTTFIEVIGAVASAPLLMERAQSERFKTRVTEQVRHALLPRIRSLATANWHPPGDKDRLYSCDLWVPTTTDALAQGIATFFVASPSAVPPAAVFANALVHKFHRNDTVVVGFDDDRISARAKSLQQLRDTDAQVITVPVSGERLERGGADRLMSTYHELGVPAPSGAA